MVWYIFMVFNTSHMGNYRVQLVVPSQWKITHYAYDISGVFANEICVKWTKDRF